LPDQTQKQAREFSRASQPSFFGFTATRRRRDGKDYNLFASCRA
jgi:hypothetical protein